ncbi:MAG TPA: fibronectin type III domain-containing protein [bacterium]|nr:fibronectin type III domain-containing protein [bacterium]
MKRSVFAVTTAGLLLLASAAVSASAQEVSMSGAMTSSGESSQTGVMVDSSMKTSLDEMVEGTYLPVQSAPRVASVGTGSVTLEWDVVEGAAGYIVKYGPTSVALSSDDNAQYASETDEISGTGTTIEGLDPTLTYYFALVGVDLEKNESDNFSDEVSVNFSDATGMVANGLSVVDASVVDVRTMDIRFSAALSDDEIVLRIVKTSDNANIAIESVRKSELDPSVAVVSFVADLEPITSYSVTVVSATDANGNTVEDGVKGFREFTTAASIPEHVTNLNAAGPEMAMSGDTMSGETASGAAVTAEPTVLPATGTKESLIVLMALLITAAIVFGVRRLSVAK